jgi:hypothetical protein
MSDSARTTGKSLLEEVQGYNLMLLFSFARMTIPKSLLRVGSCTVHEL